ncbi:hypothetical protein HDU67_009174 [Dinochytrium kinnereticum]|nr:hypothetical protein HDU67_009174 [Dinochytrium kinnereticum]
MDATKSDLISRIKEELAVDVEKAVEREGGCAAVLTAMHEWKETDIYSRLLSSKIVSMKGDESFRNALPSGDLPLTGVKVIDLTRVLAGPICCRALAGYGAEVLHVSSPNLPALPGIDLGTSFGKRSCFIDLCNENGRSALRELVKGADVFVQSYRPGALDALGFSSEEVSRMSPGIITVSISAYGVPDNPTAPNENRRGFDSLLQYSSGIASDEGERAIPQQPYRHLPCQALDHGTGWLAAWAVLVALRRRQQSKEGYDIRVSLAGTSVLLDEIGRRPAGPQSVGEKLDMDEFLVSTQVIDVGEVAHVRFPGKIRGVELGWKKGPPAELGIDSPAWLDSSD